MVLHARIGNFLRGFAAAVAAFGWIAACVSQLSAQSVLQVQTAAQSMTTPATAQMAEARSQSRFDTANVTLYTLPAVPQYRVELSKVPRDPADIASSWEHMVEFSGTPFTQQVRLPLGSLFRGRVRLGGFNAVTPMEHIQRGLPGGGSMDAWSPVPMGHGGMILPKDDNQYGFVLTFHRARSVEEDPGMQRAGLVTRLSELNIW